MESASTRIPFIASQKKSNCGPVMAPFVKISEGRNKIEMKKIVLTAETGSDIPPHLAQRYGIHLVPMHVTMGNETFDDGAFPVQKLMEYYKATGKTPITSGCTPEDFRKVYQAIFDAYPDAYVIHLAYSAVTTCSYQSAITAAEEMGISASAHIIDTKVVSGGQAAVVLRLAEKLEKSPEATPEQAIAWAEALCGSIRMCFMPERLEFLRAGGRVSNVAYLGGTLLHLHPCIEMKNGYLVAAKKYRGKMTAVAERLVRAFSENHPIQRDQLWLYGAPGSEETCQAAEREAKRIGFQMVTYVPTGGVITSHGGPGSFGIAGFV